MFREQDTEARLPAILEGHVLESRIEPGDGRPHDAASGGAKSASRRLGLGFNKRTLIAAAAAIAIVAGGAFGTEWWVNGRYVISTDDAYVHAHNTTLASKISGYVQNIPVEDNATIHAGDVIATIDDGDYKLAADAAREKVATQQATVDRIGRQVIAQNATIDQAKAQMVSAQAAAKRMQLELDRQQALAAQKFASQQTLEQAQANRDQSVAAVDNAQAGDRRSRGQSRRAQGAATGSRAHARRAQNRAGQGRARSSPSPSSARRSTACSPIARCRPAITCRPGSASRAWCRSTTSMSTPISRRRSWRGCAPASRYRSASTPCPITTSPAASRVLSPASGAVFSLLPPDNATGNFTKIVQRLPVRIEVPADVAARQVLRPGMSVVVSVNTKPVKSATRTALAGEGATTLR